MSRLPLRTAFVSASLLATAACVANLGDPPGGGGEASLIDAYIRGLPRLPVDEPRVDEGAIGAPVLAGDYRCVTQDLSETRQYDKIVAYAANSFLKASRVSAEGTNTQ